MGLMMPTYSVQVGKESVTIFFYGEGGLTAVVTQTFDECLGMCSEAMSLMQDKVLAEANQAMREQYEASGSVCVDAEREGMGADHD